VRREPEIPIGPLASPLHLERLQYYDECSVKTESMTVAYQVTGPLDPSRLADALRIVVGRHDSLRLRFSVSVPPGTLTGSAADLGAVVVGLADGPGAVLAEVVVLTADEREPSAIQERLIAFDQQPFDLENGPRVRLMSLGLGGDEWIVALAVDHIVFDPESLSIVLREWAAVYAALGAGAALSLPAAPSYLEHAHEQWELLRGEDGNRRLQYWADVYRPDGVFPISALPGLQGEAPFAAGPAISRHRVLDADTCAAVSKAAAARGSTPFNLLLAALALAMRARTDQDRIGVDIAVSNRIDASTTGLVGLVATALPIWVDLSGTDSLDEAVALATASSLAAMDNCLPMNVSATAALSGRYGPPGPGFIRPGKRSGGPVMEMFIDNLDDYGLTLELKGCAVVPYELTPPLFLPQGGLMAYFKLSGPDSRVALLYAAGGCDEAAIEFVLDEIAAALTGLRTGVPAGTRPDPS
jgi:hypothetical protein